MPYLGPEDIYLSTSLASYLDRKLLVLLRDSRKLMGTLRSFDQFANAVLEGACERVIVGDLYCDIPLGLYVIRGENVVLIGELDLEREELPPRMTRVSVAEIRRAQKAEREATDLKVVGVVNVLCRLEDPPSLIFVTFVNNACDKCLNLVLNTGEIFSLMGSLPS
ncbi:hypothetical protein V6N13_138843 [Hibiscus sabdariffa]